MKLIFRKDGTYPHDYTCEVPEITLRDQLAMHCPITVSEFMRATDCKELDKISMIKYCRIRYCYADAMLVARKQNNQKEN